MKLNSINLHNITDQVVILRVDFNVPINNNKIMDADRIVNTIPTLKYLIDRRCKIILVSHLGRPKGFVNNLSFNVIFDDICQYLNEFNIKLVRYLSSYNTISYFNINVHNAIKEQEDNEILLLDNIRFHDGELQNDVWFSRLLSNIGNVFVNDAFSCSHRKHSSIFGISKFLPSYAGLLLKKEIDSLSSFDFKNPVTTIIAGSKISTKINLINNLIPKVDNIFIAGMMANNFLVYNGYSIGKSLYEKNVDNVIKEILYNAVINNCKIFYPSDVVVADSIPCTDNIKSYKCNIGNILNNKIILDIGEKTLDNLKSILLSSKTVLWNGPVGMYEYKPFDYGTVKLCNIITKLTYDGLITSIVGGGDTVSLINKLDIKKNFTHISNGGGAFLEWIEGKLLPGLSYLLK